MASSLTTTEIQAHLDQWLEADRAVALGQSYSVAGQTVTRVDAQLIRDQISYWRRALKEKEDENAGNVRPGWTTPKWT